MRAIFFLLFINPLMALSQNLVPNGGFELYNTLGGAIDTSDTNYPSVKYWWSPNEFGTPDYIHTNSLIAYTNAPKSIWAYQYPHIGLGYVGVGVYVQDYPNNREYIETKLIQPLVQGKPYFIKFYVSLYDSLPGGFCFFNSYKKITAINCLGAYLSNSKIDTVQDFVINRIPQIKATTFLTDTAGWMEISGYYTAHGGEQYLTIGNFYDGIHTPRQVVLNTVGGIEGSYYLIDDVSVEDVSNVEDIASVSRIKLYPNPATNEITIDNQQITMKSIQIFDVMGREVKSKFKNQKGIQIDVSQLNTGIYFLRTTDSNGKVYYGKFVKE